MQREQDGRIGAEDLEKGMRAGHAREVAVIVVIVVATLLTVNSGGLVRWTQSLPSAPHTAWLAERAAEWHTLMMQLGPAAHFEKLRERRG
jgi:hypothetical protein